MDWSLYHDLPVPICVYSLVSSRPIIEYQNQAFHACNLSADIAGLESWLLSDSLNYDTPASPIDGVMPCAFSRRRISSRPGYWTLTVKFSAAVLTSGSPPTVGMSHSPDLVRPHQHATRSKAASFHTVDERIDSRINMVLRKAAAKSPDDVAHVKFVLETISLPNRIGPMHTWPDALWQNLMILFDCPFVSAIYWGDEYKLIYNYAYRPLVGNKHPHCLGLPASHPGCWGEIWDNIGVPFLRTSSTGIASTRIRDLLVMRRHGYPEELYFNWGIIPIEEADSMSGLFNFVVECTDDVLNDRRLNVLHNLNAQTSRASNFQDYYRGLVQALEALPQDLPTILMYACEEDGSAHLAGSVAYTPSSQSRIPKSHIFGRDSGGPLGGLLNVVMETKVAVICIDREILAEFQYTRGWAEPCESAVIAPIFADNQSKLLAIAFVGINPKKKLDSQYQRYLDLLFNQISIGLSNVHHLLAQVAQVQQIANMEASRGRDLQLMLEQKSEELYQSQQQFVHMARELPAGMYRLDATGKVIYRNPKTIELTGGPEMYFDPDEPFFPVHPDWRDSIRDLWATMVREKKDISYEVRCLKDRDDGSERWVAGSINVDKDANDEITGLTGFLVDTSERRRAEYLINKRADDAQESKRQQEAFIDMTSHELRNPLSAIVQSVDLVQSGLERVRTAQSVQEIYAMIDDELSTLSNVDLCAQHMRRIIDDTINISKIESNLLVITPDNIHVSSFLSSTINMFKGEAKMKSIDMKLELGRGIHPGSRFMLDPARSSQILINLITNSIKFMSGIQNRRVITIKVETSMTPPFGNSADVRRLPRRSSTTPSDKGLDSPVSPVGTNSSLNFHPDSNVTATKRAIDPINRLYLIFSVRDTGPGMSSAESEALFKKFSQCTPKTHVKYGGSGLGLYICRKLTDLQGGQIKCESAPNEGALFTFYIASESCGPSTPDHPMSEAFADIPTSHPRQENFPPQATIGLRQNGIPPSSLIHKSHIIPQAVALEQDRRVLKTLVVEDNLLNQKILQKQLLKAGYLVSVANHGLECLEMVKHEHFDVILLDREMPVCDGLECLLRLKEMEAQSTPFLRKQSSDMNEFFGADHSNSSTELSFETPSSSATYTVPLDTVPIAVDTQPEHQAKKRKRRTRGPFVIAISANAREEQVNEMLRAGADSYLTKPFRFPELDGRMQAFFSAVP